MKNILVYHRSLRVGGITTVLYHYLNILAQLPDYKIDLVLVEAPYGNELDQVPNNINTICLLSKIEAEFDILCYWKIKDNESVDYFSSWQNEIKNQIKKRTLDYINSRPPYDLIINFAGDFDSFLNYYDLHSHTKIIRLIHANQDIINFRNDFSYYRNIINKHHKLISISDDMNKVLTQLVNGQADNEFNLTTDVQRIYNPVNLQAIRDKTQSDDPLLSENYIVAVSGLYHGKGYPQMINMYHQLKQKGISQKLYIVGDGYLREELAMQIKSLGLEQDCLLLGKKDNPFPYMKNAKLLIHASESEGLPTVFIEAMTCGTPVVAFDCPTGPRDILADGQYGGLIPMGNNEQFVETVYELLTDENKRQAYIEKLPEAVERFGLEKIGQEFKTLLDNLITQ